MIHHITLKNTHQWTKFFCQLQKNLFCRYFWAFSPKEDFFPKSPVLSLFTFKTPKRYIQFHKNRMSRFWEWVITGWPTNWLTDWQADWLTDRLTDWLTGWLVGSPADWQTNWLPGWWNHSTPFSSKGEAPKRLRYCNKSVNTN